MTEISTLKMALNEASGTELTGCKVPSLGYFLVQSLKSGEEYLGHL